MSLSDSAGIPPLGRWQCSREVERPRQALVEAGPKLEREAPGVLAHAHERPQDDEVVVGRALDVDAVGAEVRAQVALELGQREVEQLAVLVQAWQREGDDEQRVELERAVVAPRREVVAQPRDLRRHAVEHARRHAVAEARERFASSERVPGVDPVEEPACDGVGGLAAHLHLLDPRVHEELPGPLVALVAGLAEGSGEVEPEVELRPRDAPLLVGGEGAAGPVGWDAERERHPQPR